MIVPIPLAGATGKHRSTQFSSSLTKNMYLDLADERWGAFDFPGNKSFGTASGIDRGWHVMAGILYKICGNHLYRVSDEGVYTDLGTVSGGDRAVFADDGSNLFFTVDNLLYRFDGSQLAKISQSVVQNPSSIAYINRQFILTGDNGLFATSDVGDGSSYNALNFAEAESSPDPLKRTYIFNQLAYMLGGEGTELWYSIESGSPPLARQDTALVNVGIAGKHAVSNSDQFIYWLGDDRKIYQCVGASARAITTPDIPGGLAVAHEIESYAMVDECVASHFVLEGQDFLLFSFASQQKGFLFSETLSYWVELVWKGHSVIRVYEKNLVSDDMNGNVYEMDLETYTDNGEVRQSELILPNITGAIINLPGQRILAKGLQINMQVGVGLETGQGVDPKVMCQFSPDGGHTWQAERHVSFGELGNYTKRVDFWDFCNGYEIAVRLAKTDPVFWAVFDGQIDVEAAGF